MTAAVISITGVYFLIGLVAVIVLNQRQDDPQTTRERLVKYVMYLLIVAGIIATATVFFVVALLIVLVGIAELALIWKKHPAFPKSTDWIGAAIYLCFSVGFFWFAYRTPYAQIIWVYLLVMTFDGFSQLSGQLFGRTKLVPAISPNKTIEGFLGGMLMTFFTGIVIHILAGSAWSHIFVDVLLVTAGAFTGDLLASWYKRLHNVKDYSRLIPGHGGVLDRFDSLIGAGSVYVLFNSVLI